MLSAFYVYYIQVHFRLDFFMRANNINHDQTAPLGTVWSGSKKISRQMDPTKCSWLEGLELNNAENGTVKPA